MTAQRPPNPPSLEETADELYDNAVCGYLSALPDGRIVRVNRTLLALTGHERETVLATRVQDLLTRPARDYFETHISALLRLHGTVKEIACDLRCADGTQLSVLMNAIQVCDDTGRAVFLRFTFFDATERRRYEANLLRACQDAERLAVFVAISADAMFRISAHGTVQTWNAAAERLLGYSAAEAIGQHVSNVIVPDNAPELAPVLAELRAGRTVRGESECTGRDARRVEVAITLTPHIEPPGELTSVSVVMRDIAERKQMEQALRQNSALFSSIIAQAPMGTYVVDSHFRVLQINAEAMPAFETVTPLIGRDFHDVLEILWGTDVGGDIERIFRNTLTTGERYVSPPFTEVRHDLGIEQTYEWETQRVTLPDGQHGVVCYFHEVTGRAQAIKALRATEERVRLATEATQVGIWEWNVLTNKIRWDAQMFRIYGIEPTPNGLVEYDDWSNAVLPEDLTENEAILRDTVQRRGRSARNFRIRRSDNEECRHIAAVETVRTNARGEAEWVVGTNLDVSERVRVDAELRRLAAELSEADRRKDEFLATLAHELRNPLAPILNGLQILRLARDSDAKEPVRAMMQRQLTQMVHLVDDLLDVSRINQGKLQLRKEPIELEVVVNSAVETSSPLIEANGHAFTVTLPPTPVVVHADLTRLSQVFSNLLNNAAKYTEPGGHIHLTVERQGNEVVVSVTDTGIGIPAHMLRGIFELFTQADRSPEQTHGGLGIGLSLVQQLVELHGGRVEARSDGEGTGSEFVVWLPELVASQQTGAPTSTVAVTRASGQLRILVADDNYDAADTMAMMLTMLGHEVRTTYDGLQAVRAWSAFTPDLILLDIGMPELNGYEACRHIRREPGGEKAVLVALTGWGQAEDKRQAQEAGFDHHLVKPVGLDALETLLAGLETRTV